MSELWNHILKHARNQSWVDTKLMTTVNLEEISLCRTRRFSYSLNIENYHKLTVITIFGPRTIYICITFYNVITKYVLIYLLKKYSFHNEIFSYILFHLFFKTPFGKGRSFYQALEITHSISHNWKIPTEFLHSKNVNHM